MALTKISHDDNDKAVFGTSEDLQIYHDGTNTYIKHVTAGAVYIDTTTNLHLRVNSSETAILANANGSVELRYDNVKKFETKSSGVSITGTSSTILGDLHFNNDTNGGKDLLWDESADSLIYYDNVKAKFGTGGDCDIYHTGSHMIIENDVGNTYIYGNRTAGEQGIVVSRDDSVELYFNGVKKFETQGDGGKLYGGNLSIYGDESSYARLQLGADEGDDAADWWQLQSQTDNDFQLGHWNGSAYEDVIICKPDAAVELYYDGSKYLETNSTGVSVYGNLMLEGDDNILYIGHGSDIRIWHDGTDSHFRSYTGELRIEPDNGQTLSINNQANTVDSAKFIIGGAVELYHNDSKKLETDAGGIAMKGVENAGAQIKIGIGSDMQLEHDGSNSYLTNTTGNLGIQSDNLHLQSKASGEYFFKAVKDGAVELYHDNSKKFETYSGGCKVYSDLSVRGVEGGDAILGLICDEGDDNGDNWRLITTASAENFSIQNWNGSSWETNVQLAHNGHARLYYNGGQSLETNDQGVKITGTEGEHGVIYLMADEGDDNPDKWALTAEKDSSTFTIQNFNGGSWEKSLECNGDGNVELYNNGTKYFETTAQGIYLTGDVRFNNGSYTGDTSHGKIQTHVGHMYIQNASNSGYWIFRLPSGTEAANISSGGTYSGSDERRKKDITTITSALSIVKQLTGRSFTWKENDQKSFGVIAQEIEPVIPEIVSTQTVPAGTTDTDPYKMVNYAALSGHFIEAIKELITKVETLETEVAALKAG